MEVGIREEVCRNIPAESGRAENGRRCSSPRGWVCSMVGQSSRAARERGRVSARTRGGRAGADLGGSSRLGSQGPRRRRVSGRRESGLRGAGRAAKGKESTAQKTAAERGLETAQARAQKGQSVGGALGPVTGRRGADAGAVGVKRGRETRARTETAAGLRGASLWRGERRVREFGKIDA